MPLTSKHKAQLVKVPVHFNVDLIAQIFNKMSIQSNSQLGQCHRHKCSLSGDQYGLWRPIREGATAGIMCRYIPPGPHWERAHREMFGNHFSQAPATTLPAGVCLVTILKHGV